VAPIAVIAYYGVGSIALIANLRARRSVVHLLFSVASLPLAALPRHPACGRGRALITIQTNLTIAIATASWAASARGNRGYGQARGSSTF